MGDSSIGRLIKKHRESLGLSQARLGELVGRSASTIRNWERDRTSPSERSDVVALAAILGLDEREALDRAGFDTPRETEHPTMEQAFASLGPHPEEVTPIEAHERGEGEDDEIVAEGEAAEGESPELFPSEEHRQDLVEETPAAFEPDIDTGPPPGSKGTPPLLDADRIEAERRFDAQSRAGQVESRPDSDGDEGPAARRVIERAAPPTVLEAAPAAEPSYLEDPEEKQQYRLRGLVTAIAIVVLVIVLIWSFDRTTTALGNMWDQFVSMLDL